MIVLSLVAVSVAGANPVLRCPMDDVLGALAGRAAPTHPGMLAAPLELGFLRADGTPALPPPGGGKPVYGTPYTNYSNSENFTVNWLSGGSSIADASWVAAELEVAWEAFVDDQGWPAPVSSDDYLLWVLLDDSLGGTTGYTTVYTTPEYPQGYPVIYLNPAYLAYPDFFSALVAHELMHALQYALRDWDGGGDEPWYWEASAQWAIEPAIPDNDVYAEQSVYYSWYPDYSFDSMTDYHQYGMFVFNAWLEDEAFGRGAMQDVWLLSADRAGEPWDDILAEAFSTSAVDLWGGFAASMGNEALPESAIYEPVRLSGPTQDGTTGSSNQLGTTYLLVEAAATLTLELSEGDAVLSGPAGVGSPLAAAQGEVVAVTGTSDGTATWTLRVSAPEAGDSGGTDSGSVAGDHGGPGSDGGDSDADPGGCACSATGRSAGMAPWFGLLLLAGLVRRRLSAART
jgi:Family of unknown function (DUF6055)